jgi:hypothetical protein
MAFTKLVQLDADDSKTFALGGINKKTGKANPKQAEGYYLGHRIVANKKGDSKLHHFETANGVVAVWGKTNLDRQLNDGLIGVMTRVTFTGMKETQNNPMYTFSVEVDRDNTSDTAGLGINEPSEEPQDAFSDDEPEETDEDETPADEAPPVAVTKANKAKALLSKRRAA